MSFSLQQLTRILFLDVETAREYRHYGDMPDPLKKHWEIKCKNRRWVDEAELENKEIYDRLYLQKSGIFAEFARIVCISAGIVQVHKDGIEQLRLKSICNMEEGLILKEFASLLHGHFNNPNQHFLCGHNLREFDVPFICRRMLIQNIPLPTLLDVGGKKPWQTPQILDTLEMWKFGDFKNYTSLDLLCTIFGFPSPKETMDGSQVGEVFWGNGDPLKIAEYCEDDVISVVRLFLKLQGIKPLEDHCINRVSSD